MKILVFDTSLGVCAAGVWRDGEMAATESAAMTQGHAETLMPMIERIMMQSELTYAALDRIAVTVGPGSFTGLRVGIATARGLAMAAHKPAIGLSTTDVLAAGVSAPGQDTPIVAAIDSKRGDVFAQVFDARGAALGEIANIGYDGLDQWVPPGPLLVVGDAAPLVCERLGARARLAASHQTCRLDVMAQLAASRAVEPRGPVPVYARAPDITLAPGGGHLRP